MKILITGANGQLGAELQKQLAAGESELGRLPDAVQNAAATASAAAKIPLKRLIPS